MSQLDSLKQHSTIVADSGEIGVIGQYAPRDATTNPSLIYRAAQKPEYRALVEQAVSYAVRRPGSEAIRTQALLDKLYVNFGVEILKTVPGRVSTETAARFSFDSPSLIAQAERLIEMYESAGVERERVLIKVSSTWEGIRAARLLEQRSIHCNLTLMFSFAQAVACAEAEVTLVSPFVGRIYDWHKHQLGVDDIPIEEDPGVAFVRRVFEYYKSRGYATQVMGASFRKVEQVLALAGCDLLTVSPKLLETLRSSEGEVARHLTGAPPADRPRQLLDEKEFRWNHNQDAMAVEKLAEGIRVFHSDAEKLEDYARSLTREARR